MFLDYAHSKKFSLDDEESLYTSLKSDERYMSQPESSYFTGILKKGDGGTRLDAEEFGAASRSPQDTPMFEGRGLLSSDSGIEMTPAESKDVIKTLSDPSEGDKLEACKYIDISRSPDTKPQHSPEEVYDRKQSPVGYDFAFKDHQREDISYSPYMEERDDNVGLYSHTATVNTKSSPVKITLTGTESSIECDFFETSYQGVSELGLKPGGDSVPTVTVSEPEDDSPESLTPPSFHGGK